MYKQIAANKRNTFLIMLVFVVIIGGIGAAIAAFTNNWSVAAWTVSIAAIYALLQYFLAAKISVAMTGAKPVTKKEQPRLYRIVENLSLTAGLPMPQVYVIDDPAPNAFASGRKPENSLVAATTGLLDLMDDKELTAVMAHELSHIKNYDIRVSMITFGLVCLVGFVADIGVRMVFFGGRRSEDRSPVGLIIMILVAICAPIVAAITQMAVSRQREFLADASAAHLTRYPEGMIAALKKLAEHGQPMKRQNSAASAMFINETLRPSALNRLFSTHPPLEQRIARLEDGKKKF